MYSINKFDSFPTSSKNFRKCLCCLHNKFHNSPDGIPKGLLKNVSNEICTPISLIFTRFLKEGFCPDIWKISYIISKFKKCYPSLPVNYSIPIVYDNMLTYHLAFYLRKCHLINDEKFAFLSGKSTELHLLKIYRNIYLYLKT